jgi:tetratricopeptide (TPR) repeat protein
MQLLQRIVQLAPPPPASPLPAVPSLSALSWLRWAGSAVAGAAVALLAAQVIHSRRAPPSAPVETAGSEPLPDRSGDAPGTASAERTLVASPIVLSMPSGSGDGESSLEGRQQPPQATRGPATPRPPTPTPKLSTPKPPDASEDELLEKGEVALSLGRAAEALAAFRAVLDAHPDLPAAVRGVALAYLMQRRDAEAKAQLERYLELAPGADDAGRMRKIASGLVSNPPRR